MEIVDEGTEDRQRDELIKNRAKRELKENPDFFLKIFKKLPAQRENDEREHMIVYLRY